MALIRTQISISDADRAVLEAVGRRTGESMSALIRDAIQSTYGTESTTENIRSALDSTFGVISREQSGGDLVDSIRSGRRLTGSK